MSTHIIYATQLYFTLYLIFKFDQKKNSLSEKKVLIVGNSLMSDTNLFNPKHLKMFGILLYTFKPLQSNPFSYFSKVWTGH